MLINVFITIRDFKASYDKTILDQIFGFPPFFSLDDLLIALTLWQLNY